jgi:two-component sensor histidine kinase
VEVVWSCDDLGGRQIRWEEHGGPPVVTPDRQGLGMQVLNRALGASRGRTQLHWRPEGLVCEFDLPPEKPAQPDDEQIAEAGLRPGRTDTQAAVLLS